MSSSLPSDLNHPDFNVSEFLDKLNDVDSKKSDKISIIKDVRDKLIKGTNNEDKVARLDAELIKILGISRECFNELNNCEQSLDEIIEHNLDGKKINEIVSDSKTTITQLKAMKLNLNDDQIKRLSQFIGIIQTTQGLAGEKTYRKNDYKIPATIKVDNGEVYVITKKVLGKGNFKKVKVGAKLREGIRVAWLTPNLEAATTPSQKDKILQAYKKETAHESAIYRELQGIKNVASFLGSQSYQSKENVEKNAFVMPEFNTSLDVLLKSSELSDKQKKQIAHGILTGLSGMHSRQVTHQDLKPDNIFINTTIDPTTKEKIYTPFIGDVGLATKLPNLIKRIGTVGYLSPEVLHRQMQKHKDQLQDDPFAYEEDVFAVGEILNELLYNKPSDWAAEQKNLHTILVKGPKDASEERKIADHLEHLQIRQPEPKNKSSLEYAVWRLLDPEVQTRATLSQALDIISSQSVHTKSDRTGEG